MKLRACLLARHPGYRRSIPMLSRNAGALHAHRWSQPTAVYFVTSCTSPRNRGLNVAHIACALHRSVAAAEAQYDTVTHAFTIMPDHVHWLFTLCDRLSLGRVIARLKTQSKLALSASGLEWQRDFFEHRLRPEEAVEPYGRYIFLNPYRAGLITVNGKWPDWQCPHPGEFRFMTQLNADGTPPAEWIDETVPKDLVTGE